MLSMRTKVNYFVASLTFGWHEGLLLKLIHNKICGLFYHLISDMYLKSQCAIKDGNQRSKFFEFNRGVRQGCILSQPLFNLYFNEFPHLLLESHDTDPASLRDRRTKGREGGS